MVTLKNSLATMKPMQTFFIYVYCKSFICILQLSFLSQSNKVTLNVCMYIKNPALCFYVFLRL